MTHDVNPHDISRCVGPPNVGDPALQLVLALETNGPMTAAQLADAVGLYTDARPYRWDKYHMRPMFHTRVGKVHHLILVARLRGHAIYAESRLIETWYHLNKEFTQ